MINEWDAYGTDELIRISAQLEVKYRKQFHVVENAEAEMLATYERLKSLNTEIAIRQVERQHGNRPN